VLAQAVFRRRRLALGLASVVTLLILAASLFVGRYPRPVWMPWAILIEDPLARRLILSLRLPRLLLALLLGASLSASGAVFQMLFRNPLVEPGFLGVSQGAAFGAAVGILWLGSGSLAMQALAIFFALLGLALSYGLAQRLRFGGWLLRLVLAGIAVSALFSAGTGMLKYLADPLTELPELTFWLLGGLWQATWQDLLRALPFALPGLAVLVLLRWRLNLLSMQDEVSWSLGAVPNRERGLLLLGAVAATASLTSVAGIVGWVGLIVPHLARRIFGADAQHHLIGSLLLGGAFTLACDDLARTLLPGEIPLGVITSLLGAAFFLMIMTMLGGGRKP